jgi:hypothetical protein
VKIYEASDAVGGRCRTDLHPEGFLLDRGFQIMLTAYPECKRYLNLSRLSLSPFYNGALVWCGPSLRFQRVADPFRHPLDGVKSLFNPVGSPVDKLLVAVARARALLVAGREFKQPETSIRERLKAQGFSDTMVQRFFKPFMAGIWLDPELQVSSRLFDFVMRMLALGNNALPAAGIGSIPQHIASSLSSDTLALSSPAHAAAPYELTLSHEDESLHLQYGTVIATDQPAASQLLANANISCSYDFTDQEDLSFESKTDGKVARSTTLYFGSDKPPPVEENILLLNGTGDGIVNNACFPASVCKTYAPPGKTLVSATVIALPQEIVEKRSVGASGSAKDNSSSFSFSFYSDSSFKASPAESSLSSIGLGVMTEGAARRSGVERDIDDDESNEEEEDEEVLERQAKDEMVRLVREELSEWFGRSEVDQWQFLRMYSIPYSHPPQQPPTEFEREPQIARGLYVCGDHRETASFDGALRSGRRAAEALLRDHGFEVPAPERPND